MPDLNWENPKLRKALYDSIRFWVHKGVEGFRLDVISRLKKTPGFPDSPIAPNPVTDKGRFVADRSMCTDVPGTHVRPHLQR